MLFSLITAFMPYISITSLRIEFISLIGTIPRISDHVNTENNGFFTEIADLSAKNTALPMERQSCILHYSNICPHFSQTTALYEFSHPQPAHLFTTAPLHIRQTDTPGRFLYPQVHTGRPVGRIFISEGRRAPQCWQVTEPGGLVCQHFLHRI